MCGVAGSVRLFLGLRSTPSPPAQTSLQGFRVNHSACAAFPASCSVRVHFERINTSQLWTHRGLSGPCPRIPAQFLMLATIAASSEYFCMRQDFNVKSSVNSNGVRTMLCLLMSQKHNPPTWRTLSSHLIQEPDEGSSCLINAQVLGRTVLTQNHNDLMSSLININ